jgi:phosphopantothenoylcysteine decarboxylase/phosphopantothenate--cysteine ligase
MSDREIIVGVAGGIAAYKTADLVSKLAQAGHAVSVVMTKGATKFVGEATFAALSGRPVATDLFDPSFPLGAHIELARRAQTLCIAPATADFMGKCANGLADDLLSTLYLCFEGPVFMAPAMNNEMWKKPSVQRTVGQLSEDGVTMIGPAEGWLSCREKGIGRMAEVNEIVTVLGR